MREDIYYRGQYSPTSAGEYRVQINEFNVFTVDRAQYDRHGKLDWWAVQHAEPAYESAVDAHKHTIKSPTNPGYFLKEQLAQFAATLAGKKAEEGVTPKTATAMAAHKIVELLKLPLEHAIANLQREELIPVSANAMQAQLLMHACSQANDAGLLSWALHLRRNDGFDFVFMDTLQSTNRQNIVRHLQLSSPKLINMMRQVLINHTATAEAHDNLSNPIWHFPEGTPISEVHTWLDQGANWRIQGPEVAGSVRVIRDWLTMTPTAERMISAENGLSWEPIDSDHSTSKAAVAAYNWAQDHCPLEGDLRVEAFRQRAANFAASVFDAPLQAAQKGIQMAKEDATRFFQCSRDLAYPVPCVDAEEGVRNQILQLSSHYLTRDGIASHAEFLQGNKNSTTALATAVKLEKSSEIALGVTMRDPFLRLTLHCEPHMYLRIGSPSNAFGPVSAQELKNDLTHMAVSAGLAGYTFKSVDSLTAAHPQANEYKVQLITSKLDYGQDTDAIPDGDDSLHEDVYEAAELKRLFRDKGICETPSVAQFGDGSWEVTWRSESSQENREFFAQGIETQHALKLISANGDAVTPEIAQVFASEVGVTFSNPYAQPMSQASTFKFG